MGIDMNQEHTKKNNRTSSDPMDKIITVRIDTEGKGGRLKKRGKDFPPHLPISGFLFYYRLESQ